MPRCCTRTTLSGLALAIVLTACGAGTSATSPGASPDLAATSTPVIHSLTPTIPAVPPNDNPPGIVITSLPFADSVTTTLAQIHATEGASVCGSGSQSVWYAFTATEAGTLVADTLGSDYDTIVDIWAGSLTTDYLNPGFETLSPLACNDNSSYLPQSEVVFAAVRGQSYVIRVSTALNASGGNLTFHLYRV